MNSPIRIKTFRSKTMQSAIEMIRRELGPDASILETKTKTGVFGRSRIEVVATSNAKDESDRSVPRDTEDQKINSSESVFNPTNRMPGQSSTDNSFKPSNLPSQFEHRQEKRLVGEQSLASIDRVCSQVLQELLDAGINPTIASQWVAAARDSGNQTILQDAWTLRAEMLGWIKDFMHVSKDPLFSAQVRQRHLFLGPPGAGKTTTIAKIAANLRLNHQVKVGVIEIRSSSDQPSMLPSYTAMMDWDFEMVSSAEELSGALQRLEACQVVLMDSQGCSPTDATALKSLDRWKTLAKPDATHLVMPSTLSERSFVRFVSTFDGFEPDSLVLTRLDEAGGLGPLFSALQNCSIPVSYLSHGPHVPSDLLQATTNRLAQQMLGGG